MLSIFFCLWIAPVYGAIPNWKCDESSHVSGQCEKTRTSRHFSAERKSCTSLIFVVRSELFVDAYRARMFRCNAKRLGRLDTSRPNESRARGLRDVLQEVGSHQRLQHNWITAVRTAFIDDLKITCTTSVWAKKISCLLYTSDAADE